MFSEKLITEILVLAKRLNRNKKLDKLFTDSLASLSIEDMIFIRNSYKEDIELFSKN
jgi:hypothetical protein